MTLALNNVLINSYNSLIKDPTGFYEPEKVTVTYNATTRTVTLTGEVRAFFRGKVIKTIRNGWVSDPHSDVVASYFLYYDGASIKWSTTPWSFDNLQICYVYYGTTNRFGTREIHSFMPNSVHNVLHNTVGCFWVSGGTLSNYIPSSTTAINRRPYIAEAKIQDEDLQNTLPAHTSQIYTKMYLSGANTNNFTVETAEIVPLSGTQPYYNQLVTGTWQQTLMDNNTYQSLWLIAIPTCAGTNCQKFRFVWVQGQSNGSLTAEQATTPGSINLGELSAIAPEFVFLAKVIIRYNAGDWSITQVDNLRGTKLNQVSVSGGYLSSVAVDGVTITGSGVVGDPLVSAGGVTYSKILSVSSLRI